ncbi:hypothetical protein ACFLTH_13070 [Bacteroidota bacterium]
MSSRKITLLGILVVISIGIMFQLTKALSTDPAGMQSVTEGVSSSFNGSLYEPGNTSAQAGNITQLQLTAVGPTKYWQGYYGEITGVIKLEDATGNVLYNWSDTEPQGQILASISSSITWADVDCMDGAGDVTVATEEAYYNINTADSDGISETFTASNHPDFVISGNTITGCDTAWTMVNGASQQARFPMILLEDDTNDYGVYATFIENRDVGNSTDVAGFDGNTHDFQFMVPENGTNSNTDLTTYYFWVIMS